MPENDFRYFDVYEAVNREEYGPPLGFIHYNCRPFPTPPGKDYVLNDAELGGNHDCMECGKRIKNVWFEAILAKNDIARYIARLVNDGHGGHLSVEYLLSRLEELEEEIGVANQPSVRNIFEHNTDPKRGFNI